MAINETISTIGSGTSEIKNYLAIALSYLKIGTKFIRETSASLYSAKPSLLLLIISILAGYWIAKRGFPPSSGIFDLIGDTRFLYRLAIWGGLIFLILRFV